MRAVLVREFGGPEQLRLDRAADPVAGPGQVRTAVHAAEVNPVDAGNRADGRWAGLRVPSILGYDVAGAARGPGPEDHPYTASRHAPGSYLSHAGVSPDIIELHHEDLRGRKTSPPPGTRWPADSALHIDFHGVSAKELAAIINHHEESK
jgi:NADPH:quinone reductase-like Zn-dependent oxidoreductase